MVFVQVIKNVRGSTDGNGMSAEDRASGMDQDNDSDITPQNADEVGYKTPPKRTRFPKGMTGNAKGRPKKVEPNLFDFTKSLFGERITTRDGTSVHSDDAFIQTVLKKALSGHSPSFAKFIELADKAGLFKKPLEASGGVQFVPIEALMTSRVTMKSDEPQ